MGEKRAVVLSLMLVLILMLLVLSQLPTTRPEHEAPELVRQMIATEGCQPPCFFGYSLAAATVDEVYAILSMIPLTQEADLWFTDDGEQQEIRWQWPEDVAVKLNSGEYPLYGPEYESRIVFRGNRVWSVYLSFSISLGELIDTFSNPVTVMPWFYTRFGSEIFALHYPDLSGYFEAWTSCSNPELLPDTEVKAYLNRASVNEDVYKESMIPWEGYTDALPDCTVFQP